ATPRFHHWHHANDRLERNRNFAAQLSLFDRLFGTYYLPSDRTPTRFGVDDPVPGTYLRNLGYPLFPRYVSSDDTRRSIVTPGRPPPATFPAASSGRLASERSPPAAVCSGGVPKERDIVRYPDRRTRLAVPRSARHHPGR